MPTRIRRCAGILIGLLPLAIGFAPESGTGGKHSLRKTQHHVPSLFCEVATQTQPRRESQAMYSSTTSSPSPNEDFGPGYRSKSLARKQQRKPKASGAPIVDSTLLRFISTQKKAQRKKRSPENIPENTSLEDSFLEADTNSQEASSSFASSSQIVAGDQTDPWMGQFNRNRISQKLMSLGVDQASAMKAGESVQDHVLMRTARRRVREFLRERDNLWNSQGTAAMSTSQQIIERKILNSEAAHPEYGFDDVVDIFLEYGLTGKDISAILVHTPSLALMMPRRTTSPLRQQEDQVESSESESATTTTELNGETLEETLNRAFTGLLCTTLKLRKYDARNVLRRCPGLLSKRGSQSAVQVVSMMSKLGSSTSSIARDKAALPTLLSRSPASIFRLVSFLGSNAIRMPINKIGPLIRRKDSDDLLNACAPIPTTQPSFSDESFASDSIDQKVETALYGRESEIRRARVNEVYSNMTRTALILRDEIGTQDLGKIISAYPSILLLDPETQILPAAYFLMDELGIMEGDLVSVLQLYPSLLGKDVSEMNRVVQLLISLNVELENLPIIFRAFPAILSMDIEKEMIPVIEFLEEIGISNIGRFVTRLPPVLGYSVENELRPKWDFLNSHCMYASFELTKFPAYFSYPFERVIKARYEYLEAHGYPTDLIPVDTIVRFGEKDFATKVARDEDDGLRFRSFLGARKSERSPSRRRQKPKPKKATGNS